MEIRKSIYLFFVIVFFENLNANVIYEKNNKIITDLDIKIYKQLYKENYGSDLNDMNALKDLILIKGVIDDLIKKNPKFIERIDNEILNQFGAKPLENENIKEFIRFSKIRDEFIINYFRICNKKIRGMKNERRTILYLSLRTLNNSNYPCPTAY